LHDLEIVDLRVINSIDYFSVIYIVWFGVHRGERVDLSSRVDLLRYQEDRTIEEDAWDILVEMPRVISNPRSSSCDR